VDERIEFLCAGCRRKIAVPVVYGGRRVKCPACGQAVAVPAAPPAPASEPAAPPFRGGTQVRIVLGLLVVLAGIALVLGNLVTRLIVLLMLLTVINGYWLGAANVAAGIVGMVATAGLAVPVGRLFEGACARILGTTGLANRMASVAICGVILATIGAAAVSLVLTRVLKKWTAWKRVDRLVGAGLGLFEGALLGILLIWGILALEPMAAGNIAQAADPRSRVVVSPASSRIVALAKAAHDSTMGQVAGVVNPLRSMRMIGMLADAQIVLNDPQAREAFLHHPKMVAIHDRPAVRRALDLLAQEPLVESLKDGVSGSELRRLLDSPRLLAVLDETNLVAELAPVAEQIAEALADARESQPPTPQRDAGQRATRRG
jgi:DNA-directed RNA polymerase subunit RPC12/RpoP